MVQTRRDKKVHFSDGYGFIYLGISSIILLIISMVLADQDPSTIGKTSILSVRIFLALLGPLLTFIAYFSVTAYFFKSVFKLPHIRLLLNFTVVSGLIAVIFAISLNSRAVLAIILSAFAFNLNLTSASFILYAIIAPIVEESAKILPVFFLSRGLISKKGSAGEQRLFSDFQTPVFLGLLSGFIFNLLETYWYSINISYLFLLDNPEIWFNLRTQLIIRSINQIHALTTGIAAYGIAIMLWNSNQKIIDTQDYYKAGSFFIASLLIHGIWNGSLVLVSESTYLLEIGGVGFPIFNWLFIIITLPALFFLIHYVSKLESNLCDYCNLNHAGQLDDHTPDLILRIPIMVRIKSGISKKRANYTCRSCKNIIPNGIDSCNECNSKLMFGCSNCNAPLPVYSQNCWRCLTENNPVFDNVMSFMNNFGDRISEGIIYILTISYIGGLLTFLVLNINGQISIESDFIGVQIVFLAIIGSCLVITIKWLNTTNRRALGISITRVMVSLIIFEFSFLLFGLSGLFFGIGIIGTGILFFIEFIIFVMLGLKSLDFQPFFHGEDYE